MCCYCEALLQVSALCASRTHTPPVGKVGAVVGGEQCFGRQAKCWGSEAEC